MAKLQYGKSGPSNIKECETTLLEYETDKETYHDRCNQLLMSTLQSLRGNGIPKPISIIVVVLPEKDRRFYPEVKRWGDCIAGIPTFCITSKKIKIGADCMANVW